MLYLIKSGEYIKVGFSRDVLSLKKRMESYKTHNPNVLLLGLCEGTAEDECNYHRKLDAYKLYNRAEWFKQEALPLIVDDFKSGEIVDEFNAYFNKRTGEGGYPQLIKYYIMTKDPSYELEYPEFKEIVKFLMPKFEIVESISSYAREEKESYIQMTSRQGAVLHFLQEQPMAAIHGPAGTGKTLLAVQKAKMLAEQGKKVLYLCFNEFLFNHLRNSDYDHEHITFHNVRTLAEELMEDTSLAIISSFAKPTNFFLYF